MRRWAAWSFATTVVVVVAVSGCTTSSPGVASTSAPPPGSVATSHGSAPLPSVTYTRGLPPNRTPNTAFEAYAVWADRGRMDVVTFGSSPCPKAPTGETVAPEIG